MTLANIRAQGVRSLWVVCDLCHHEAVLNVDRFGDDVPVPAFGPRTVCKSCGIIAAFRRGLIFHAAPVRGPAQLSNYQATSVGNDTFTVAHGGPG
jgi:hypothetical protein